MKRFTFIACLVLSMPLYSHIRSERLDEIEVKGHNEPHGLVDFVPSVTQVKGTELQKRRQTSIGETLQSEAGVNSTYFGPSASRPVIRGLDGDRIKILQNGLGTLDASTQSLDHAVPVDMLTIDQIEIVRGPLGLLYGSSAVGGVINLLTNRIHSEYEEGFFSQALAQGETANKGTSEALLLNYGAKRWMFHADGSTRNLGDQRIPPYAKGGTSEEKGKIPNSFNKQDNVAVGASHILDQGYFGLSLNHFNTVYGSVAEESVKIDMNQNRGEFHGEWRLEEQKYFNKFRLKSAQSDYIHREIEDGETGTTFKNAGNETRFEAYSKSGRVEGVSGLQTQFNKFSAEGDEAFLPSTRTGKVALFTYQELGLNEKNSLNLAGRLEDADIEKKSDAKFGPGDDRNYLLLNGSLGHKYRLTAKSDLGASFSYTERAPTFQELYADGDHIAIGAFEQGDGQLVKEKAYAFEASYKIKNEKGQFVINAYTQVFKDYISLNPTGLTGTSPEGFTEFRYEQEDAIFYGADLELRRDVSEWRKGVVTLFSTADVVRAKNTDNGKNLPRISPPRVSAGLEYSKEKWNTDLEVQYVAHQSKTAPNESATDAYTLTNAGYMYSFLGEEYRVSLFARVRNIFDVVARNHLSPIKEIAPLPGRNFILGIQAQL